MRKSVIFPTVITLAVALLLLTSFTSFAASTTVTVQTNASSYTASPGTSIIISGTVSPAPGISGAEVSIQLAAPGGSSFIESTSVNAATGAYSYTYITGPASSGWTNGTYGVTATYAASLSQVYTGTTSFQYGTPTTTATSSVSTSTTTVTTTVTSTTTSTTTSVSVSTTTQSTTVTSSTTITTPTTLTSTTTTTSTTTQTSTTWEYIGIAGIAAAIALAGVAVFSMRRR